MELIKILRSCGRKRALVFGIGGGGDIVSTIPVANFFKLFDFEVICGCVLWDRLVVDPKPGPRRIDELLNAEKVRETLAFVFPGTRTQDGIEPNLSRAARFFGKVLALDINYPAKLAEDLASFLKEMEIEVVIGVDAGGDAIGVGFESGIKSPLADAISVSVLKKLRGIVAVTGFGSDGELKFEELLMNIAELFKQGRFLGCTSLTLEDCIDMEKLASHVVTEASRIPILARKGEIGIRKIRKGRTVLITPLSALVFYFAADGVYELNEAAKIVSDAENLEMANLKLNRTGILTELDYERAIAGKS